MKKNKRNKILFRGSIFDVYDVPLSVKQEIAPSTLAIFLEPAYALVGSPFINFTQEIELDAPTPVVFVQTDSPLLEYSTALSAALATAAVGSFSLQQNIQLQNATVNAAAVAPSVASRLALGLASSSASAPSLALKPKILVSNADATASAFAIRLKPKIVLSVASSTAPAHAVALKPKVVIPSAQNSTATAISPSLTVDSGQFLIECAYATATASDITLRGSGFILGSVFAEGVVLSGSYEDSATAVAYMTGSVYSEAPQYPVGTISSQFISDSIFIQDIAAAAQTTFTGSVVNQQTAISPFAFGSFSINAGSLNTFVTSSACVFTASSTAVRSIVSGSFIVNARENVYSNSSTFTGSVSAGSPAQIFTVTSGEIIVDAVAPSASFSQQSVAECIVQTSQAAVELITGSFTVFSDSSILSSDGVASSSLLFTGSVTQT